VVTPSYNQGGFIRETLESVLAQDYPHIEHLVIDGGSTDETAAVVAEYSGRLSWISEPDRGQSDAINKGFRRARGDIVCWLNSDDVLMPLAVSKAVAEFERDADLKAVYGDAYRIDRQGEVIGEFPKAGPPNLWKLVYHSDYISQPTVFLRRRALDEVGYLDESLHWGMDWDLFIRLGKQGRIAYIRQLLASQREYDDTKTASGGFRRFRELVRIMRRHARLLRLRHRYVLQRRAPTLDVSAAGDLASCPGRPALVAMVRAAHLRALGRLVCRRMGHADRAFPRTP
jgi:glycosyltransferase involved in cell wall biosynthesis